jgi:hypothetical protein
MLLKCGQRKLSCASYLKKPAIDRVARIVNPAYVRTPLLQENLDSPGFNYFVIEPETVADAVVIIIILHRLAS